MQSLLRARIASIGLRQAAVPIAVRPLSTTAIRRHGESQSTDPEFQVEKLKQASLQRQKSGKGEWMPDLASDSEEAVKADKSAFSAKEAVDHAKNAHGSGKQPAKNQV